jgi:hypothetical protein
MTETKRAPKDIAILSGPTEDGQGARVVRIREGVGVSAGEIRPVREGEPINQSELVRLHPLDQQKRVCAVEVLHAPEASQEPQKPAPKRASGGVGPARVSNARYRRNWNAIFGAVDDQEGGEAPPDGSDWSLN